ncbi:hypothetical protein KR222_003782 [Zaprionus bogoriensis]|nr:hypothetical protein KR222_003782 [Zaprionus bogoriensis]
MPDPWIQHGVFCYGKSRKIRRLRQRIRKLKKKYAENSVKYVQQTMRIEMKKKLIRRLERLERAQRRPRQRRKSKKRVKRVTRSQPNQLPLEQNYSDTDMKLNGL